jgi:hypothetical protein
VNELNHVLLATGFGKTRKGVLGMSEFLGPRWGNGGFCFMRRNIGGYGQCNIVEHTIYPMIGKSPWEPRFFHSVRST